MSNNQRLAIRNIIVHRDGAKVSGMSFEVFFGGESLGHGDLWADGSIGGSGPWLERLTTDAILRVEALAYEQGRILGVR